LFLPCRVYTFWNDPPWRCFCKFIHVTFDQNTKLNIERRGLPDFSDEDFTEVWFHFSSFSLIHPDILAKFPNIKKINLNINSSHYDPIELNNPERLENCHNITHLVLPPLKNFTAFSSDTLTNCKKLVDLWINTNSPIDLPDGFFKNQKNLRELSFWEKQIKLRVSPFEGLKNLTELKFYSVNSIQVEENFFQSLNIRKLSFHGNYYNRSEVAFPIESLNSQETIEELTIEWTNMNELPEYFGPILSSMKQLKEINLCRNMIRSVEAFVDLPNVESIDLTGNEIEEIPANAFKGCPQLTYLKLAINPITILRGHEFNQLSGLKNLYLDFINLASIAPTTFHPLKSLERLGLYESLVGKNNIIEKELFVNLNNLRILDLSRNNIVAIQKDAFKVLPNSTSIKLRENICVDEDFWAPYNEALDMEVLNEKLKTCYSNFPSQEILD
jgi:Leucine-rich repeat (LRR) protein